MGDCKPIKALHEKCFTTPNVKQKALTNVRAFLFGFSLFCAKHAFFTDTWWVFEGLHHQGELRKTPLPLVLAFKMRTTKALLVKKKSTDISILFCYFNYLTCDVIALANLVIQRPTKAFCGVCFGYVGKRVGCGQLCGKQANSGCYRWAG